ncbi:MAG: hypothetical protein AAFQ82_27355, partial [Myxococcota bacterium]
KNRSVYVLDGVKKKDTYHSMQLRVANEAGTQRINRDHQWVERTVDYSLREMKLESDWQSVKKSAGLPAGLSGVPRDETRYTECVAMSTDEDSKRTYERGGFLEGEFEKVVHVKRQSGSKSRDRSKL